MLCRDLVEEEEVEALAEEALVKAPADLVGRDPEAFTDRYLAFTDRFGDTATVAVVLVDFLE